MQEIIPNGGLSSQISYKMKFPLNLLIWSNLLWEISLSLQDPFKNWYFPLNFNNKEGLITSLFLQNEKRTLTMSKIITVVVALLAAGKYDNINAILLNIKPILFKR